MRVSALGHRDSTHKEGSSLSESRIENDPLGPVLNLVDVQGLVLVYWKLGAPWGFAIPSNGRTYFHVMVEGRCRLEVEGVSEPVLLEEGDFVVLPHGTSHTLRDDPRSPAPPLADVLRERRTSGTKTIRWGGSGARAVMVCGEFRFADRVTDPLLVALPQVLHIQEARGDVTPWLERTLEWIAAEMDSETPGSDVVVQRLADIMFIQALRSYLQTSAPNDLGGLRGLKDPKIARVLAAIHRHAELPWTVAEMADRAHMSRSAFAQRFRSSTGFSPMQYLTRWRLSNAAALLRRSDTPIHEIARAVGYDSDVSFNKAFKRYAGLAPGAYRDQHST